MSRADSPLRDRVVFVVGARRSGTNWLRRILTAHADVVVMPSETYLFSDGIEPLTERFQHANPGSSMMAQTFMGREHFLDATRAFVDAAFLDNLARLGPDARYLMERTPWHARHLPLISDVYPDARVIHIYRDGRAVARSLVSMEWGPSSIEEAAEEWTDSVERGRGGSALFGERYREVRYETLMEDPVAGARELFAWLGLEWNDEVKGRVALEAATEYNVDPASPGVRTDKWRDELSAGDVAVVDRVAGAQLDALGYERSHEAAALKDSLAHVDMANVSQSEAVGLRVRKYLGDVRRPRRAARSGIERVVARRLSSDLDVNYVLVERFENAVARGDTDAARKLVAPHVWARLVDGEARREGRGAEFAAAVLGALEDHRARGLQTLTGERHASSTSFTAVGTYRLSDGSRWTRTMVFEVLGGKISSLTLHRFQIAVPGSTSSA